MKKPNGSEILKQYHGLMGGEKRSKQVIISTYFDPDANHLVKVYAGPPERPVWRTVPTGFYTPLLED